MPLLPDRNLEDFRKTYAESPNNIAFFVGAGLSQPIFPSWGKVLLGLLDLAASDGSLAYPREEIEALIQSGQDYLEVADALADALDISAYRSFLSAMFDKDIDEAGIPSAYRQLFELRPKLLLTTNYDRIPNVIAPRNYRMYTHEDASDALAAINSKRPCVLKVHGDIQRQDSIILTRKDYNRVMHQDEVFQSVIRTVFGSQTVLFVGFSLTDPHLALVLAKWKGLHQQGITHYALMPHMSNFRARAFERAYGVRVIRYKPSSPAHPEVGEFLELLKRGSGPAKWKPYPEEARALRVKKYETFDPRGIISVTSSHTERIQEYKRCLMEATGDCFISGTSMVHLVDDSKEIIQRKLRAGCRFRLLIMDPDWNQRNCHLLTYLPSAKARAEFHHEIRNSIEKIRGISESLPVKFRGGIQLKTYKTFFPYIVTGFDAEGDGKLVVEITDYMPEASRPRFTVHPIGAADSLFAQVKGKFDRIWEDARLTKKVALR